MKLKSFLPFAAAALMALAACTNDDDTGGLPDGAVPIRITAGVTPHVATRANGSAWHKDQIGVVVSVRDDNNNLALHKRYGNMHYATTADGTTTADFTAVDAQNTIYLTDTEPELRVCAYAPYQSTIPDDGEIYIDTRKQSTAAEQEAIDFLYTFPTTVSKDHPSISFTNNLAFRHLMTRLVLKIQLDEQSGFTASDLDKITAVKIGRLCTGGLFYMLLYGGTVQTDYQTRKGDYEWDITDYRHETITTGGVTQRVYTLILIPQAPDNTTTNPIPLSITLDGKEYKNDGDIKPGLLTYGHSYEYTVLVKRNELTVTASSEDVPWTPGEAPTVTLEGKSFRLIHTAEDLARFAADVNAGQRDLNALQTADIDLQDLKNSGNAEYRKLADNWVPINEVPNSDLPFTGIYNGNGYAISGLRIRSAAYENGYAGLFGKIGDGALLTGIRLVDAQITSETGRFIGTLAGFANANTTVSYCSATGKIEVRNGDGLYAGGLVGLNKGAISCCQAHVAVTADVMLIGAYGGCAGGITGSSHPESLLFGCHATGNVTLKGRTEGMPSGNVLFAGGISGSNAGMLNADANIYCCLAEGKVSATSETAGVEVYAGGLTGSHMIGELKYSYARGTATASSVAGNTDEAMWGAIVGRLLNNTTKMEYCYGAGEGGKGTSHIKDGTVENIGYGTNPEAGEIYKIITNNGNIALSNISLTYYSSNETPAYGMKVWKRSITGPVVWNSGDGTWPVIDL